MVTSIWTEKGKRNVKPDRTPPSSAILDSFLFANNAPRCFAKLRRGWYKISKDNKWLYVERTLYLLSFEEWLKIALDDNFTGNIPT